MGFFKCDVSSSDYTGTCVVDQANGMSYPESGTCLGKCSKGPVLVVMLFITNGTAAQLCEW